MDTGVSGPDLTRAPITEVMAMDLGMAPTGDQEARGDQDVSGAGAVDGNVGSAEISAQNTMATAQQR